MRLETTRLELRSAVPGDAPSLQSLFSNPEVLRYLPPIPPMTLEQATQAIERRMKMEAERGYAPLIITIKESGAFIGSGGVLPTKGSLDIEIAYHFLPSAWGKGYATEAAVAILEFAFKTAELEEIVGFVFFENVASWRVLEKAGMRFVGMASYPGIDVPLKKYVAGRAIWTRSPHDP